MSRFFIDNISTHAGRGTRQVESALTKLTRSEAVQLCLLIARFCLLFYSRHVANQTPVTAQYVLRLVIVTLHQIRTHSGATPTTVDINIYPSKAGSPNFFV